jgi:hypothetical protein
LISILVFVAPMALSHKEATDFHHAVNAHHHELSVLDTIIEEDEEEFEADEQEDGEDEGDKTHAQTIQHVLDFQQPQLRHLLEGVIAMSPEVAVAVRDLIAAIVLGGPVVPVTMAAVLAAETIRMMDKAIMFINEACASFVNLRLPAAPEWAQAIELLQVETTPPARGAAEAHKMIHVLKHSEPPQKHEN